MVGSFGEFEDRVAEFGEATEVLGRELGGALAPGLGELHKLEHRLDALIELGELF